MIALLSDTQITDAGVAELQDQSLIAVVTEFLDAVGLAEDE